MCAGMRWAGRFSAFSIAQTRPVRKRCGARPAIIRAIRFVRRSTSAVRAAVRIAVPRTVPAARLPPPT